MIICSECKRNQEKTHDIFVEDYTFINYSLRTEDDPTRQLVCSFHIHESAAEDYILCEPCALKLLIKIAQEQLKEIEADYWELTSSGDSDSKATKNNVGWKQSKSHKGGNH